MDFELTEEHKMIEKMVYDFARAEILPIITDHDRNGVFPSELTSKMAAQGFLGVCLPARYGGAGMDYVSLGLVSEGLREELVCTHAVALKRVPRVDRAIDHNPELEVARDDVVLEHVLQRKVLQQHAVTEVRQRAQVSAIQADPVVP